MAINHVELASLHAAAARYDKAESILAGLARTEQDRDDVVRLRKRMQYDQQAESAAPVTELEQRINDNPDDLQARNDLAARLLNETRYQEAMEQYLEIMSRDRAYGDDAGRKSLLDVFNLLGNDDPLVGEYRRKMASVLY